MLNGVGSAVRLCEDDGWQWAFLSESISSEMGQLDPEVLLSHAPCVKVMTLILLGGALQRGDSQFKDADMSQLTDC